jgi:hypothetical protein
MPEAAAIRIGLPALHRAQGEISESGGGDGSSFLLSDWQRNRETAGNPLMIGSAGQLPLVKLLTNTNPCSGKHHNSVQEALFCHAS